MQRREFMVFLTGCLSATSLQAQSSARPRRVAVYLGYSPADDFGKIALARFEGALNSLNWSDGANITLRRWWATEDAAKTEAQVRELMAWNPDVIFASHTPTLEAIVQKISATPVVFASIANPRGSGLIETIAQPGRNFSGFTNVDSAVGSKMMELLIEMAPDVRSVFTLFLEPSSASQHSYYFPAMEAASRDHGLQLASMKYELPGELDAIFEKIEDARGGVVLFPDASNTLYHSRIITLSRKRKIPLIGSNALYAKEGALLTYGADRLLQYEQAAGYVDRILKGAQVGTLPVQAPIKYHLVINRSVANDLGLSVPARLLSVADEIIG